MADDGTVFDLVEYISSFGDCGFGCVEDLAWEADCYAHDVGDAGYDFLGKVLDDCGDLAVLNLLDELLGLVGVGGESLDYVAGNVAELIHKVVRT